jgi:hypothetical protein
MAEDSVDANFSGLSQCLTGFGPMHITLALQTFDYQAAMSGYVGPEWVARLVDLYAELKADGVDDAVIADKILSDPPDPHIALLARSMIKLWYLGIWLQPLDCTIAGHVYRAALPPDNATGTPPTVVATGAYANALVWKAMQAHPAGISHDLFGSWHDQPLPLAGFIA